MKLKHIGRLEIFRLFVKECKAAGSSGSLLCLIIFLSATQNVWGQGRSTAENISSDDTEIVLQADAPCMVLVDGVEIARLNAGGVQRVFLPKGQQSIEAIGEHPEDRWETSILVEPGIKRVVIIGMKRVIAERQQRQKSKLEREREAEDRRLMLAAARTSLFEDASYIAIPPGIFRRSGPDGDFDHEVAITKSIAMGKHEVTQAQWEAVMGKNPSDNKGAFNPVESVSWFEVQAFLDSLNTLDDSNTLYRLPTEAEWEYACRANVEIDPDLDPAGWYIENAGETSHRVGQKTPNVWGLFDMRGNVWEWVEDWHDLYDVNEVFDPVTTKEGRARVIRGGSWWSPAEFSTCTYRGNLAPDYKAIILGFRIVREELLDTP